MFTGIIHNLGKVKKLVPQSGQIRFTLQFLKKESRKIRLGESIAVDGVCLTVADFQAQTFSADVIDHTLKATTLGNLKVGSEVNLERAMCVGDEIGGHFVSGHVDGVGEIIKITKHGNNRHYLFRCAKELVPYLAFKGSVAVDGISLTLQRSYANYFEIGFVPHTLKITTIGRKKAGDKVNLEVDLIARYLRQLQMSDKMRSKKISLKELKKQGF